MPDDKFMMQVEDEPKTDTGESAESTAAASIDVKWRIAMKSESAAANTQEAKVSTVRSSRLSADAGKAGLMKKSMHGSRHVASNWKRDWQDHVQHWRSTFGIDQKNPLHHKEDRMSGVTHKCHIESSVQEPTGDELLVVPWECIRSRFRKSRETRTTLKIMHREQPAQEFRPLGEEESTRRVTEEPRNRMNHRYRYRFWTGKRSNSAECHIGNANGVFRAREIWRLKPQDGWDKEVINRLIGILWRTVDGEWTADRSEVQGKLITIPPLPLEGVPIKGERIQRSFVRLARYLKCQRRWGQVFEHGAWTKELKVLADLDWASHKETRK